jgi:SAM-dependent methyltransferase
LKRDYSQAYFDRKELWTADAWRMRIGDQERARLAEQWLPNDARSILDVGCGNGLFANMEKKGRLKIGIDLSMTALEFLNAPAIQADAAAIPFQDSSFDASLSMEMMEHLPESIYSKVLKELKRVSRRYILISVPYNENLQYNLVTCPVCRHKFHPYGHLRQFKVDDVKSLFSEQFELVQYEAVIPVRREVLPYIWNLFREYLHRKGRNFPRLVSCPQCGYSVENELPSEGKEVPGYTPRIGLSRWWPKRSTFRWWLALYHRKA